MGAQELSALLWRERELLDLLVFKLEEEQLLLTAGKSRWLAFATREVEQVLDRLRESGLQRALGVARLAAEWNIPESATLREIIAAAPTETWSHVFSQHLEALTEVTSQIASLRDSNVQFLRAATRSTQETLAALDPEAGTYDASGATASSPASARLFESDL